jgi:hypothetical protein
MECFHLNNREHVFTVLFCYVELHGILIQSTLNIYNNSSDRLWGKITEKNSN